MNLTIAISSALALAYSGMAGLCLAMDRHHGQVWGGDATPARRRGLRIAGSALLALALLPCLAAWGTSVGIVAWLGFLSAGALLLVALLPYAPRLTPVLGAGAGLLALAALGLQAWV